jgi:plastocyanin
MRVMKGLALISLSAALLGCGAGGGEGYGTTPKTPNTPSTPGTPGTPSTSTAIDVNDASFDPAATTVAVGATVTWTWRTTITHNVTFNLSSLGTSGDKNSGSFAKNFGAAGTFSYHCTIHQGMTGTVTVQ